MSLSLAIPPERLWPADAAWATRPDISLLDLLGFQPVLADMLTGMMTGCMGTRPAVRHASVATEGIRALFRRAGYDLSERTLVYQTEAEAQQIAQDLVRDGYRIAAAYPFPPGQFADSGLVVPPALWAQLNRKDRLADLVPSAHLPRRQILSIDAAQDLSFAGPVFVKHAGPEPTGWGFAVRACRTAAEMRGALAELQRVGVRTVVVEAAEDILRCWCVCIVISEEAVEVPGAALQTFSEAGRQSGSLIDPEQAPPDTVLAVAAQAGRVAQRMGYRGPAGMDIGLARDGRVIAFDPNFRLNSSSAQVLLHQGAVGRAGSAVSLSVNLAVPLPMAEALVRLEGPVSDGSFIPTRLGDAALLPVAEGLSRITGFVLGETVERAEAASASLSGLLS